MPSIHDLGGHPAGRVNHHEHVPTFFEKRVDAMLMLLSDNKRQLMRVDELRRTIEQFDEREYFALSYYERWLLAICQLMVEKGVLTRTEIDTEIARLAADSTTGATNASV